MPEPSITERLRAAAEKARQYLPTGLRYGTMASQPGVAVPEGEIRLTTAASDWKKAHPELAAKGSAINDAIQNLKMDIWMKSHPEWKPDHTEAQYGNMTVKPVSNPEMVGKDMAERYPTIQATLDKYVFEPAREKTAPTMEIDVSAVREPATERVLSKATEALKRSGPGKK